MAADQLSVPGALPVAPVTGPSMAVSGRWLAVILAAATLLRLALGWVFFGFLSGDDVEILEAAFRGIGLHYSAWAIRNNLLADVVVRPFVATAHDLGVTSPRVLIWVASWPFVALATLNIVLLHRLARAWSPRSGLALTAAALSACPWLPLGFGSMTYPRTVSTTVVLAAALLLAPAGRAARRPPARPAVDLAHGPANAVGERPAAAVAENPGHREVAGLAVAVAPGAADRFTTPAEEGPVRSPWREILAGLALALAFTVRYSEAVYLPAVALLLLAHPAGAPWRARLAGLARLAAGFAGGALLLAGVYEAVAEGRPFGSLLALLRFTVVEHQTSSVTALHPFLWYLWRLPHWWCPAALPLAVAAVAAARGRRLAWAWAFVLLPLLALSCIQFKELRYLQGLIPFVCLLSAAGALVLWDAGWRRTAALLCAATMVWGLARLSFLAHKSMPAVLAARALVTEAVPAGAAAALSAADGPDGPDGVEGTDGTDGADGAKGVRNPGAPTAPVTVAAEGQAGGTGAPGAAAPARRVFAATQIWAYGDQLYLGGSWGGSRGGPWELRDIPYPATTSADVERLAAGADAAALYAEDLARQPGLGAALARHGLCPWRGFRWHGARAVTVFRPCRR